MILSGLRKLQDSLADAAGRSRVTPSVIVALSGVRSRYDELMATAANGPGATLGQRLYVARGRAKLSTKEAANGVGLRKDLIEAVEAEEPATRTRPPDQGPDRRARRLMTRSSSRASVKP